MTTDVQTTTSMYRIYIKAPIQKVWDAIVDPEWNARYGYPGSSTYDLRPGGAFAANATEEMQQMGVPAEMCSGEVIEVDPPNRLVQTWQFNFAPEQTAEGARTLTYDLVAESDSVTRLTLTHDLTDAPLAAEMSSFPATKIFDGGGGWPFVLADLKSLLETGEAMLG